MKKTVPKIASIILSILMIAGLIVPQTSVFADDPQAEIVTEENAFSQEETDTVADAESEPEQEKEQPAAEESKPDTSLKDKKQEPKAEEAKPEQKITVPEKTAGQTVYPSSVAPETLSGLDFTSMRLIVQTSNENIFPDPGVVIAANGAVHLLQFSDVKTAMEAYGYFVEHADSVEVDAGIAVAEGTGENASTDDVMTEQENPIAEMQEAIPEVVEAAYDIALIDTGANGADKTVSVLGNLTADDNGHGTVMLNDIREQAPKARVLSIKALDAAGMGSISSVYAALQTAMASNVKIINLSISALASADSEIVEATIKEAASRGILVVGAAGNNAQDASLYIPGRINEAVIVGAASFTGERLAASNYGATVDYNVVAGSTSSAAAKMSGFITAKGMKAVSSDLNKDLIFATDYIAENPDIHIEVLWGKGTVKKIADNTYKVIPEEGYQIWRVTGYTEYLERRAHVSEQDGVYVLNPEAKRLRVYFITPEEYSQIRQGAGSEERMQYIWDNPRWFFEYGTKRLTEEEQMIVYRDFHEATWMKQGAEGTFDFRTAYNNQNDWTGITLGFEPEVGDTWVMRTKGNTQNQDHNEDYTFYADPDTVPAQIKTLLKSLDPKYMMHMECVENLQNYPVEAGTITMKITAAKNGNYEGTLVYTPDVWETQTCVGYFSGVYKENGNLVVSKTVSQITRLVVKKELAGSFREPNREFTFKITYQDASDSKWHKNEEFKLKGGGSKTFTCVPGSSYKVEEVTPAGYDVDHQSPTGTLDKLGQDSFMFTAQGSAYPSTGLSSSNEFMLGNGDSKTINDLTPDKNVKVTEVKPGGAWDGKVGWRTRVKVDNGSWSDWGTYSKTVTIKSDKTTKVKFHNQYTFPDRVLVFTNIRQTGSLTLEKTSSLPDISNGNDCFDLTGAKYAVYPKSVAANDTAALAKGQPGGIGVDELKNGYNYTTGDGRIGTFIVQENAEHKGIGYVINAAGTGTDGTTMTLPVGEYRVVETAPGKNYTLNSKVYTVNITKFGSVKVSAQDTPGNDPASIEIQKISKNANYETRMTLEGTRFEIKYYDNMEGDISGEPTRTWVLITIIKDNTYLADIRIPECIVQESSDSLYYDKDNNVTIPRGTISVEEIEPATGYTLTGAVLKRADNGNEIPMFNGKFIGLITGDGRETQLNYGNLYTMLNTPIEVHTSAVYIGTNGHYVKASEYKEPASGEIKIKDSVTMSGLDVTLPSGDNPEVPVTWKLKGKLRDVASGDTIATAETGEFSAESFDETKKSLEFTIPDAKTLEGHVLFVSEELYYYLNGEETFAAAEDETIGDAMSEETKESQRIHLITIGTTLTDESGEHTTTVKKDLVLKDTVTYKGLIPGHTYVMKGKLMDKKTGDPMKDDDGKEITAEKEFVPESFDGSVTVTFRFPAVTLHGKKVVAFESLYEENEELAVHADLDDDDQTVEFPECRIGTTLTEKETELHEALVSNLLVLTDEVAYENLATDAEYVLKGILMDADSGEALLDDNGNKITAESEPFTPEEPDGTVSLDFAFPAITISGHKAVAFEELFYEKKNSDNLPEKEVLIAEHKDLEDEGQTVSLVPVRIGTTFTEAETQLHQANIEKTITLKDTVSISGAAVGLEYTMTGTVMDKATGKALLDPIGKPYETTITFVPDEPDWKVDLTFEIAASSVFGGKTLVAFEQMDYKEPELGTKTTIAEHKDLEDEGQTVEIIPPELKTTLLGEETGTHEADAADEIVLIDTISYKHLIAGRTYVAKGKLVTKDGKPAKDENGNEITAEEEFVAQASSGTVEVTFRFKNPKLAGKSIVAFERIYEEGELLAIHEDPEDEEQTVWFPDITTKLLAKGTLKTFGHEKELSVTDEVKATNLVTDTTYLVKGYLVNQKTGYYLNNDGSMVKDKTHADFTKNTFTATDNEAQVDVPFKINTQKVDFDIVCYEELYEVSKDAEGKENVKLVANHSDINNNAQTIRFREKPPVTGDTGRWILWLIIGAAFAGCSVLSFVLLTWRRKED